VVAGTQLRSFPRRALEVEQVVEEYHLAPADSELALAQEQPIAAEAPALGDDHAFRAPVQDRHKRCLGTDPYCANFTPCS
jgi:hypothetical protein